MTEYKFNVDDKVKASCLHFDYVTIVFRYFDCFDNETYVVTDPFGAGCAVGVKSLSLPKFRFRDKDGKLIEKGDSLIRQIGSAFRLYKVTGVDTDMLRMLQMYDSYKGIMNKQVIVTSKYGDLNNYTTIEKAQKQKITIGDRVRITSSSTGKKEIIVACGSTDMAGNPIWNSGFLDSNWYDEEALELIED